MVVVVVETVVGQQWYDCTYDIAGSVLSFVFRWQGDVNLSLDLLISFLLPRSVMVFDVSTANQHAVPLNLCEFWGCILIYASSNIIFLRPTGGYRW